VSWHPDGGFAGSLRKDFQVIASYICRMTEKSDKRKARISGRCYVEEFASPRVRWVEGAKCPICGGDQLMDAYGMALCVPCNKFIKPKRKR